MIYTIRTLEQFNPRYCNDHSVSQSDVDKAHKLIAQIETRLTDKPIPQDGDIIICIKQNGETRTERGHIEAASWCDKGELTVCVEPYVPFIFLGRGCNTSGGYWFAVKPAELEYVGRRQKKFCTWGNCGACTNGAFDFLAEVNVWKFVDSEGRRVY